MFVFADADGETRFAGVVHRYVVAVNPPHRRARRVVERFGRSKCCHSSSQLTGFVGVCVCVCVCVCVYVWIVF